MSGDRVLVELADGILGLTLNRPDKRNALDTPAVDGLRAALERAELDARVRVVALRGAGPDFCAGADLTELLASAEQPMAENEAHAMRLGDVFVRMRELPKPVVGLVHGRALAGGCGLASACDIVLAHEAATFGYPEVRRGFVPAMVMAMLRRAVGEKVAVDLVMTGRLLSAPEAVEVGLVSRVIAADRFDEQTGGILRQLAEGSPSALALIKRQLYELDGLRFTESIALGARVNATARSTPDFAAAVARFLDKA
jgi:methylglutaconyl-CoA hydratase